MSKIKLQVDNISKILLVSAAFLTGLQVVFILLVHAKLPPQVPLFYSLPWGENQLASPQALWLLPGICVAAILINFLVGVLLRQMVLTRVLCSSAFLVTLLSLITLGKIIMLETL